MSTLSPTSTSSNGPPPAKRVRLSSPIEVKDETPQISSPKPRAGVEPPETYVPAPAPSDIGSGNHDAVSAAVKASHSSSFRNVSACNRCRLRKNRCDQKLPSCASCEKAGVKCVGYDPITKREIPRSYVFYLEDRVAYLEKVLLENNITFAPAEVLEHGARPGPDPSTAHTPSEDGKQTTETEKQTHKPSPREVAWNKKQDESEKLNKLVSNVGSIPVQGASDSRFLGSTSGISFARVVFAAVKSSVSGASSDKSGVRPSRPPISSKSTTGGGTSMRDSFFGLHTKPTIKQAPFPNKDIGRRLVDFYFEHANPQIPILHRGEFMKMFELAYADGDARVRTPRELYMLNIVFAIGAGIFLEDSDKERDGKQGHKKDERKRSGPATQCQPEEYHASAIVHLESCLSSPSSADRADGFGGGLEELQSVLLLAGFALLRPVAPGLWYIIGVAVRLAVDLGLHYEDGKDIETGLEEANAATKSEDAELARMQKDRTNREKGRRQWVRDFRRRLWWCTYSFDRLVSTCVGRPFGITDQVITTEFPTLLDDKFISPTGFSDPPGGDAEPSYKHVAYHYFRLRLLQSEILQVLQHQTAQHARAGGANRRNPYMHTTLPSPFMSKFDSFRSWRLDIDKRLWEWKSSAPTKTQTGVAFLSIEFVDLNYWQCVIMLYRQSLSVPPMFEGEFSTSDEVETPQVHNIELREDEERVFLKVAEAGQRILRLYRQLHRVHLVNYTFLATHHLFMAGISFLYAIWHSPVVRSRLTMDEVDFTILAATSVLGDLIEKCPPAEACRDAFDRMSKATVQMCMSTTGFSSSAQGLNSRQQETTNNNNTHKSDDYFHASNGSSQHRSISGFKRPKPTFDTNFQDLLGSPTTAAAAAAVSTPRKQKRLSTTTTVAVHEFTIPLPPARTNTSISASNEWKPSSRSSKTPSDHAYSPPLSHLDTTSIDPSLLPSPSAQGQAFNQSIQATYNMNPYQELQFPLQNAPGMDFLLESTWGGGGGDGTNNDGTGNGGNGNNAAATWTGDLGMGLGWEGLDGMGHDFSEGGNGGVDLFEGFFFGGTGGY